ncbi:MAG TPA: phosphatase PAP2 family protein [Gaiellaceae bacterium]|nr:phosphatase PAP2 family protein [Gaiellaceae bacterium]
MASSALADLDRDLFTWVVEHRAAPLDVLFVALSVIGQAGLVWIALAPLLALRAGKPVLFTTLVTAATVWTADLVAVGLKGVADRERPYEVIPVADPLLRWDVSSSLPSGHAATSAAGALILAYLIGRGGLWLGLLAVAIGFSRVYIGVHYPLDVLAGAAVGLCVGLAAAALLRRLRPTSAAQPRSGAGRPAG